MRHVAILAAVTSGMLSAPVAFAAGSDPEVRFVHAVPGVGAAVLSVAGSEVGSAGFGEATSFVGVPAGSDKLDLAVPGGTTLSDQAKLEPGHAYTVVAMATEDAAELVVFEDEPAVSGKARLRMIHASPELGVPDIKLGGKMVAEGAQYQDATRYWTLAPGDYRLRVEDPKTGEPVLEAQQLALAAGTSSTALIVGGGGEPAEAVLLSDSVSAPAAAPAAGFGGLGDAAGGSWLLTLAAAMIGGALGATGWTLAMRARAGRGRGAV